jgi:hypothetical protein
MISFEIWIARHRRRLSAGLFLAAFADAFAVFLLAFGTAVLVVKLARPDWWPHILWLAVGTIPVAIWAWRRSVRGAFSFAEAVALLDRRVGARGLLMTLSEAPDPQWNARLASVNADWKSSLPRFRPMRTVRRLWLPVAFAFGCCWAPLREARTEMTVRPNVVGPQVAESLAETLKLLKENEVLDKKEAEQLKDAIEKLAQESKGAPLTHESWEVADSLRDKMRVRAEEAMSAASKARDALDALSADLSKLGGTLTAERREQLQAEALESLRKLSKEGKFAKASPELQKQLQRMLKEGRLQLSKDPVLREQMLSDLKAFLEAESMKLAKARGEGGESDGDEFNDENSDEEGEGPGKGGVDRGRGDAKLTWGDESEENGIKFKETILPPGTPDKPNKEVISQSATTPKAEPAAAAPRAAGRSAGPETGRETWNRTLRPRHRVVVRTYFDSPHK